MFNLFSWLRQGARRAVLEGVQDAARDLAQPPPQSDRPPLELPEYVSEAEEPRKAGRRG